MEEARCSKKIHKILSKTPVVESFLRKGKKRQACSFNAIGLRHVCFPRNYANGSGMTL